MQDHAQNIVATSIEGVGRHSRCYAMLALPLPPLYYNRLLLNALLPILQIPQPRIMTSPSIMPDQRSSNRIPHRFRQSFLIRLNSPRRRIEFRPIDLYDSQQAGLPIEYFRNKQLT